MQLGRPARVVGQLRAVVCERRSRQVEPGLSGPFAAQFRTELAANDELFAFPISTSATPERVFRDNDPQVTYVGEVTGIVDAD